MLWSYQLTFDCAQDPRVLAAFWGQALRYVPMTYAPEVVAQVEAHPEWHGTRARNDDRFFRHLAMFLPRVPEPKVRPNRVQLAVAVLSSDLTAEADRLVGLGATIDPDGRSHLAVDEDGVAMVDPEG